LGSSPLRSRVASEKNISKAHPSLLPASYGGTDGRGAIFQVAPPTGPGGQWTESVIYSFGLDVIGVKGGPTVGRDDPLTPVVIGANGVLYGTTSYGGPNGGTGGGVAYSLTPTSSGSWRETVLYAFPYIGNLVSPGTLALGESGILYGAINLGGSFKEGTIFALKPPSSAGGAWTEVVLHTFSGPDGEVPTGVAIGSGGVLYGTTFRGGINGYGTVFALTE
jgi:hypothetical protein